MAHSLWFKSIGIQAVKQPYSMNKPGNAPDVMLLLHALGMFAKLILVFTVQFKVTARSSLHSLHCSLIAASVYVNICLYTLKIVYSTPAPNARKTSSAQILILGYG